MQSKKENLKKIKNSEADKPIGIFDSGIGGLTVLKAINELLPNEKIVYLGDTARLPYGSKSKETIIKYAHSDIQFLLSVNVKMIVVACNTVSSVALPELFKFYKVPIIGVVIPGSKAAISSGKKNIGIIGTRGTILSKTYPATIRSLDRNKKIKKILQQACPLFVPLIEEGLTSGEITELIIKKYIESIAKKIDLLVLGCTHYPLIKDTIKKLYPNLMLVDSSIETAKAVKIELNKKGLLSKVKKKDRIKICVTDISDSFYDLSKNIINKNIKIEKVFI